MAWLRIDDRVRTHPKIVQAGPAAAWFWFCGICYAREHLTDGFLPTGILPSLAPGVTAAGKLAKTLVACRLWHEVEGGYQIHDFTDWNPTRAEVMTKRAADLARKQGRPTDSAILPRGISTDSASSSRADSAATRAGGHGLGYGYGSETDSGRSAKSSNTAESSPPAPVGPVPVATSGALIGRGESVKWQRDQDRQHAAHHPEVCTWKAPGSCQVCMPAAQVAQLADKLVSVAPEARAAKVVAWARAHRPTVAELPANLFRYWDQAWDARQGPAKPVDRTGVPSADETSAMLARVRSEAGR